VDEREWLSERFEEHRSRLRAVAYRMLGSVSEADDAVQDAWLRVSRADSSCVENLGAWLTTVVARVCLNALRTRRTRRSGSAGGARLDHTGRLSAGHSGGGVGRPSRSLTSSILASIHSRSSASTLNIQCLAPSSSTAWKTSWSHSLCQFSNVLDRNAGQKSVHANSSPCVRWSLRNSTSWLTKWPSHEPRNSRSRT